MRHISAKRLWVGGLILFTLTFIFLAITAYNKLQTTTVHPTDLGSRLEYIGKNDLGCFLWWCETEPYTSYYFATNMTEDDLKNYFGRGSLVGFSHDGGALITAIMFGFSSQATTKSSLSLITTPTTPLKSAATSKPPPNHMSSASPTTNSPSRHYKSS